MAVVGQIIFYLVLLVGVLITPLGAPGTWLIVLASAIYAWASGFAGLSLSILGLLVLIALLLEGAEFLLSVKLAQKLGTGKAASWAALLGAVAGGIWGTTLLPLLGSLIGALAGAFLGAVIWELIRNKPLSAALHSGMGAFVGRGGAMLIKTCGAIVMAIIVVASCIK